MRAFLRRLWSTGTPTGTCTSLPVQKLYVTFVVPAHPNLAHTRNLRFLRPVRTYGQLGLHQEPFRLFSIRSHSLSMHAHRAPSLDKDTVQCAAKLPKPILQLIRIFHSGIRIFDTEGHALEAESVLPAGREAGRRVHVKLANRSLICGIVDAAATAPVPVQKQ
jgi:hypothetical protein